MTEVATRAEAEEIDQRFRSRVSGMWDTMTEAWTRRVWVPLGFESWSKYCESVFEAGVPKIPAGERPEIVGKLRSAGMSTRGIAAATGIGRRTIIRNGWAGGASGTTSTVTGTDGKTYHPPYNAQADREYVRNAKNRFRAFQEMDDVGQDLKSAKKLGVFTERACAAANAIEGSPLGNRLQSIVVNLMDVSRGDSASDRKMAYLRAFDDIAEMAALVREVAPPGNAVANPTSVRVPLTGPTIRATLEPDDMMNDTCMNADVLVRANVMGIVDALFAKTPTRAECLKLIERCGEYFPNVGLVLDKPD